MLNRPTISASKYSTIIVACFFILTVLILFSCKKGTVLSSVLPPQTPADSNQNSTDLHLTLFDTLSKTRYYIVAGAAGNKILFAGGMYGTNCFVPGGDYGDSIASVCLSESTRVDIYDASTQSWSTHELARYYVQQHAITIGNKIYFTGGVDTADRNYSKKIDIYDAAADSWSVSAEWSKPRHSMGVGSLGNKIFFAGGFEYTGFQNGFVSNKVDIYDVSSNSWSVGIGTLSEARCSPVVASVGNKILFASGSNSCGWGSISGRVDIYDATTNTWSVSALSETREGISSIVIDDKVFFVGGTIWIDFRNGVPSYKMDIYDNSTQSWSVKQIDFSINNFTSLLMGNRGYFFSGRQVNIYNHSIDSWSAGLLDQELNWPAIIAVGDYVYFAGGQVSDVNDYQTNKIWRLKF